MEVEQNMARQQQWQKGCPNLIPGLRASPVWDTSEFPWIRDLEGL
jgi:aspartate beta-hydroxylase